MYFKIGINSSNVSSVRLRINYIHEMVYLITLCFKSKFRGKNNQQLVGSTSIRGGNSKSLEVKSEGIRVLHNYRPTVASDSFRYLRRIPSLGIFLLLLPLAHLQ